MRLIALVFCVVCIGHARRVQISARQVATDPVEEHFGSLNAENASAANESEMYTAGQTFEQADERPSKSDRRACVQEPFKALAMLYQRFENWITGQVDDRHRPTRKPISQQALQALWNTGLGALLIWDLIVWSVLLCRRLKKIEVNVLSERGLRWLTDRRLRWRRTHLPNWWPDFIFWAISMIILSSAITFMFLGVRRVAELGVRCDIRRWVRWWRLRSLIRRSDRIDEAFGATGPCCICLGSTSSSNPLIALLPCRHALHRHCYSSWVSSDSYPCAQLICPLCRRRTDAIGRLPASL